MTPDPLRADEPAADPAAVATVAAWGGGRRTDVPEIALHEMITARANEAPDEPALIDHDRVVTRAELDRWSNRFARHLTGLGVVRGDRVAVCLPRSIEAIGAQIAALKVGAAFVPLDPTNPPTRLAEMLTDAAPAAIVSATFIPLPPGLRSPLVLVDTDQSSIDLLSDAPLGISVGLDDPAWVLFTSGSTGRAKGVIGRHRTEVNRAVWRADVFPPRPGEAHAHRVAPGFVDMIIEVFGALAIGLPLVVVPQDDLVDPWRFVELLSRHRVSRAIVSPSYLRALLDAVPDLGRRLPHLWLWNVSGEAIPAELARRFFTAAPHATFLNTYGSTEAPNATFAVLTDPPAPGELSVPAGGPVDNLVVKVVDDGGRPAHEGIDGEIWVAGCATAIGYLGDAELTAARFVPDAAAPGGRWYRTGDVGRWLPDGTLAYVGRNDRQVKVRGMRVELDEIEARLAEHPGVREAAVVAVDGHGGTRLTAYLRVDPGTHTADVRSFLGRRVSNHVVPHDLVTVDDFPRTSSGKLDRRALFTLPSTPATTTASRSMRANEAEMAALWAEVLERDPASIGRDDDFFDLGGHSLLAIELFIRMEEQFGVRLPIRQIFESPTVAGLAAIIGSVTDPSFGGAGGAVRLSEGAPDRASVFCVAGLGSTILGWRRIAAQLDDRIPVFGLESMGFGPDEHPLHKVEDLAAHHVELITEVDDDAPVVLVGHSFGGLVVYEMARLLASKGTPVAGLVLIDTRATRKAGRRALTLRRLPQAVVGTISRRTKAMRRTTALRARKRGLLTARSSDDRIRWVLDAQRVATAAWDPQPYEGPLTLLAVRSGRLELDDTLGWGALVTSIDVRSIPGEHQHLLTDKWAATTAAALTACLLELTAAPD